MLAPDIRQLAATIIDNCITGNSSHVKETFYNDLLKKIYV